MKKLLFVISTFCALNVNAQNYLITFAGTGASTTVNSVKVENLNTGITLTLNGDDVLRLTGTVGISDALNESSSRMLIYPNPMTDKSTLLISAPDEGEAIISVYDITGKVVTQIDSYLENYTQEFTISGLRNGMHLINVKGDSYQLSGKLISNGKSNGAASIEKVSSNIAVDNKVSKMGTKGVQATVDMEYTAGDLLKITGVSGNFSTVVANVPVADKTITFNFIECVDGDNNNYPIVEIGDQIWMATNLNTSKYSDGTAIPYVTNNTSWASLQDNDLDKAYCYYNNDENSIYGALYTSAAVMRGAGHSIANPSGVQGVCPVNWHVPSTTEWWALRTYLDLPTASGKLKSISDLWASPNTGATDEFGFSALPGGDRRPENGTFRNESYGGTWHTTYLNTGVTGSLTIINLLYLDADIHAFYLPKSGGYSVRCVKD